MFMNIKKKLFRFGVFFGSIIHMPFGCQRRLLTACMRCALCDVSYITDAPGAQLSINHFIKFVHVVTMWRAAECFVYICVSCTALCIHIYVLVMRMHMLLHLHKQFSSSSVSAMQWLQLRWAKALPKYCWFKKGSKPATATARAPCQTKRYDNKLCAYHISCTSWYMHNRYDFK